MQPHIETCIKSECDIVCSFQTGKTVMREAPVAREDPKEFQQGLEAYNPR